MLMVELFSNTCRINRVSEWPQKIEQIRELSGVDSDARLAGVSNVDRATLSAASKGGRKPNKATRQKIDDTLSRLERDAAGYDQQTTADRRSRMQGAIGAMSDGTADALYEFLMTALAVDVNAEFGNAAPRVAEIARSASEDMKRLQTASIAGGNAATAKLSKRS